MKDLSNFGRDKGRKNGINPWCRSCKAAAGVRYRKENPAKVRETSQRWADENPEKVKERQRRWAEANPDRVLLKGKRASRKIRSTAQGKINSNFASLVCRSLKGNKKDRPWEEVVGYTLEQLKRHIERRFAGGMSWANYGSAWHIDHIIPRAAFNFESPGDMDFKRCWALTNLQPLAAKENMSKKAKIKRPFQPSLTL